MLVALLAGGTVAHAQDAAGAVLELGFTPAPRAQIAVWLEDDKGHFLRTLQLTEAVAFRGLGNRPGASEMNSGYRWPYGRREGVLPIWASRRAAAPSAKAWKRVIFQRRTYEGLASRTSNDQSPDQYYCLSFNQATTTKGALDAVSCASLFSSDKGRFITQSDVDTGYHEPYEDPVTHAGAAAPLSLTSLYPPRMDLTRCTDSSCFDHVDVAMFAQHARDVMPEIDAVAMATPPGNVKQSLLFSLPAAWPKGDYVMFFEINVEGDYNSTYNDKSYPTPTKPTNEWDSWAETYGYAYRGQPSVAFQVPFTLGDVGETTVSAAEPSGRASWDVWTAGYGALESSADMTDDASGSPGSGSDRLHKDSSGKRLSLNVRVLAQLPEPDPTQPLPTVPPPGGGPSSGSGGSGGSSSSGPVMLTDAGTASPPAPTGAPDAGAAMAPSAAAAGSAGPQVQHDTTSDAVILPQSTQSGSAVGPVRGLTLGPSPERLHAHEWITIRFAAASSAEPLHSYEVRVSSAPIVDEVSFIRDGRQAKTATADPEGAVALMLPVSVPAGREVSGQIGDLSAQTHYFVGVRATDDLNRHGPISVAEITTQKRVFATVSPCFVATAAYGSPLAAEVGALRRLRDRQLMSTALGRAFVRAYYSYGPRFAALLRESEALRGGARALLEPVVAFARWLEAGE